MTISLELIKPTDAFTKKYVSMFKAFRKTYEGTTRTESQSTKELLKLAREDIENKYIYWIKEDRRIIGFALAPITWDHCGKITGRFLDTRYILESHRGKGIGSVVLDILVDQLGVHSVKINSKHLEETGHYWGNKGFRYAVPACAIDKNFSIERNRELFNKDYLHWYIIHENDKAVVVLIEEGLPMLDLKEQKKINF